MRFIRYAGRPRADDDAYKTALQDEQQVVLDPWSGADGNIAWRFKLDGRAVTVPLSAHARDLFDLACMVYIADEIVPRAGGIDQWTREMAFTLPVFERANWEAGEGVLAECLSFLSGDGYAFTWLDRGNTVPARPIHKHKLRAAFDTVCLFSGGVDSLLGAETLLRDGRRVLLVGHYADRVTSSAQSALFRLLRSKYPQQASLLQIYVARSQTRRRRYELPEKAEISHRTRSFLFLAAGVMAASATGVSTVYIPENGLIALNSPLGASRRGTLSTRTTHPRYLEQFNIALQALGFDIRIENPFGHQSKTDMVQAVVDTDIRAALLRSVSCAHAGNMWQRKGGKFTHCGYCVPCLYRRVAFLAAGMSESGYEYDVFTQLPKLSAKNAQDFRLLVRFARRIEHASHIELIATVLRHGGFSGGQDGEEYTARAAMLKRWAAAFMDLTRDQAKGRTRRILGL
ncbi:MAG TPA: Qat anti-phage system QueC-like protein QatC [Thermoanaerobaculia bacterium]